MIFVFLFCYFIDFFIFFLYFALFFQFYSFSPSLFLQLFLLAVCSYKRLGYLLIAFRNSSIAEFYIIKLYTCTIYIYYFLFIKPILRIKNRTSFLYSLALSLSLSLTAAMVLSVLFLFITWYPSFSLSSSSFYTNISLLASIFFIFRNKKLLMINFAESGVLLRLSSNSLKV